MFTGSVERIRGYKRLHAARFVVTAERPLLAHRDGDPDVESVRIEVAVRPRALTIVVPAATASDPAGPFVAETTAALS
jgi:diacylglycerol kinase family enzyme